MRYEINKMSNIIVAEASQTTLMSDIPILTPPSVPGIEVQTISSPLYGGQGGIAFDDGIHDGQKIEEICIKSHGVVNSIALKYNAGKTTTHGGKDGSETQTVILREDEYITEVVIRSNKYKKKWNVVQCLTFKTNLNRLFGPCGDNTSKENSQEVSIIAPKCGYGLIGIQGREGRYLDAIGFHWGYIVPT